MAQVSMRTYLSSKLNANSRESVFRARQLLQGLIDETLRFFSTNEGDNLKKIRMHLFDLLDAKPPQTRAQNFRTACILLDKQALIFNQAFQVALQTFLNEAVQALVPVQDSSPSETHHVKSPRKALSLSLIDVSEVERVLLLDRVAQRFTAHYSVSVNPLSLRLAGLLGLDSASLSRNPFRPDLFVRAFLRAWEDSGLDDQITEDLLLSLDPLHSADLAPLYADLNTLLINAGVETLPMHRIRKSADVSFPPSQQGGIAGASSWAGPGEDAGSSLVMDDFDDQTTSVRSISNGARRFLKKLGLGSQTSSEPAYIDEGLAWDKPGEAEKPTFVSQADQVLMAYLGELQGEQLPDIVLPEAPQPDWGAGAPNVLRQIRGRNEIQRAPELDRGTLDALAEVFDFVFADETIPLAIKYILGRLQIPVLKAAMIDRDFFQSADHPARQLIDTLAQSSIAWAPEKGETDPLFLRIEHTVQRVLNEFDTDLALFGQLLAEFQLFLLETEQQMQGYIEPVVDQELAGESYEQAQAQADRALHDCVRALPPELPLLPFLIPVLKNQWREVLTRAGLNVLANPLSWEDAVTTLNQLIWSTQPKVTPEDRRELIAALPALVQRLDEGFDTIEWAGDDRANFTRKLISTHVMAIRMSTPVPVETSSAVLEEIAVYEAMSDLDSQPISLTPGFEDDFEAMARTFCRGLWFNFSVDATTQYLCRLSWVSPMRSRMLFTNRDGFDAFVRSERDVAALLRFGRLTVINQMPIVSRALEQILCEGETPS